MLLLFKERVLDFLKQYAVGHRFVGRKPRPSRCKPPSPEALTKRTLLLLLELIVIISFFKTFLVSQLSNSPPTVAVEPMLLLF